MSDKYILQTSPTSRVLSPRTTNPSANSQVSLTVNEVSRIVNSAVKEGELVKGHSRIQYRPYQKKVIEYEDRQYVEKVPVKRKVVEYEERKVIESVPREVVETEYYAIENIKQYFKEIIPEKKIEMVPVERKVKRVEFVPVQRQIVHCPQDSHHEEGRTKAFLQQQGVSVQPNVQYKPIDPRLIYKFSDKENNRNNPIGYVEDGKPRYLSTSPSNFYRSGPLSPRFNTRMPYKQEKRMEQQEQYPQIK